MRAHPPTGDRPIYLVKFTGHEYLPTPDGRTPHGLLLGTLHSFRKMENPDLRDPEEGQRGLDLIVRRPSDALEELRRQNPGSVLPSDIGPDGTFVSDFHLLHADHLSEFNTWAFCCSAIDDLRDLPALKDLFGATGYYFITSVDGFANALQSALVKDLQSSSALGGSPRIRHPEGSNVSLDGWKDFVRYSGDSSTTRLTVDTYEEFLEDHRRNVDQRLWLTKPTRFAPEREYRFLFFATAGRQSNARFSIDDDSVMLSVDLSGCVSLTPAPSDERRITEASAT